jgi:hypothetical protein
MASGDLGKDTGETATASNNGLKLMRLKRVDGLLRPLQQVTVMWDS